MHAQQTTKSDTYLAKSLRVGVAVVAEGGGQRGIFTAGVLDAFLDNQLNPFQIGLGVSAGAQNLLSYFIGEKGYAKRAIAELTAAPGFFVPYRWLGERGVIDLDRYFESTVFDPEYRLPYQRISNVQKYRQLFFVATNRQTMQPMYLQPDRQSVITYLKASSAVPFLYKATVNVAGQQLVDGGVADPLPILKAIELGAKYIVVIRTVSDDTAQSSWRQRIDALPLRRVLPASLLQMLNTHEQAYARAIEIIQRPPVGVNILSIAPQTPLQSHAFGSSSEAIVHDYETGRRYGAEMVARLQSWLPAQTNKNLHTLTNPAFDSA